MPHLKAAFIRNINRKMANKKWKELKVFYFIFIYKIYNIQFKTTTFIFFFTSSLCNILANVFFFAMHLNLAGTTKPISLFRFPVIVATTELNLSVLRKQWISFDISHDMWPSRSITTKYDLFLILFPVPF